MFNPISVRLHDAKYVLRIFHRSRVNRYSPSGCFYLYSSELEDYRDLQSVITGYTPQSEYRLELENRQTGCILHDLTKAGS